MKKLMLSLLCAGTMSISGAAHALPTQWAYAVTIESGFLSIPVGTAVFDLDADIPQPLAQCQYMYSWDNHAVPGFGLSAQGLVVESKSHGAASCALMAQMPVQSVIRLAPTVPLPVPPPPPGFTFPSNTGFDRLNMIQPVMDLMLGEDRFSGALSGLICFGSSGLVPASHMAQAIRFTPMI